MRVSSDTSSISRISPSVGPVWMTSVLTRLLSILERDRSTSTNIGWYSTSDGCQTSSYCFQNGNKEGGAGRRRPRCSGEHPPHPRTGRDDVARRVGPAYRTRPPDCTVRAQQN